MTFLQMPYSGVYLINTCSSAKKFKTQAQVKETFKPKYLIGTCPKKEILTIETIKISWEIYYSRNMYISLVFGTIYSINMNL